MKILFSFQHPGYLRHFEPVVRRLATEGHAIHLAFTQIKLLEQREGLLAKRLDEEFPLVTYGPAPKRADIWAPMAKLVRGAIDYLRYLDPRYDDAVDLRARVSTKTGLWMDRAIKWLPFLKFPSVARWLLRVAHRAEYSIPVGKEHRDFIQELGAERVLVTPLINFVSDQVDFIKAARAMSVPSALCVASWDNLSNKGLIRVQPDAVIVWNEAQRSEAVEMHGSEYGSVIVTGSQSYDKWFDQSPGEDRETFCKRVGLNPEKEFVAYLCSSPFIGGTRERGFVEEWIRTVRASGGERARDVGILIRPHPQNAASWQNFDETQYEDVAIYPRAGANPITTSSQSDFHDSLYYSAAIVGINTSGMIEAGILGKPVLTVLAEGFEGVQTGTLHFHHLIDHGLVILAKDLAGHLDDLETALNRSEEWVQKNRRFVESFVRPHGLETDATSKVRDAIVDLAFNPSLDRPRSLLLKGLMVIALAPARVVLTIRRRKKRRKTVLKRRKTVLKRRKTVLKRGKSSPAGKRLLARVFGLMWRVVARILTILRLKEFVRSNLLPRLLSASQVGAKGGTETAARKALVRRVTEARGDKEWLVVGPWLSEVGFEVLYWIPFIRWAQTQGKWDASRTIVVSRGGVSPWYKGIADHYVDVFDMITVDDYRERLARRWASTRGQKQTYMDELDHSLIGSALARFDAQDAGVLHPHVMYNGYRDFWRGRIGMGWLMKSLDVSSWPAFDTSCLDGAMLPERYFAVKFYFRPSFPDNETNRQLVETIIRNLTRNHDVVLLNTGLEIDDHPELMPTHNPRVHRVDALMDASDNLKVQTALIARSDAFIGTYGGLSYLPLFLGVPSFAFYSAQEHFIPAHLDVAHRVARENGPSFSALDVAEMPSLAVMLGDTGVKHDSCCRPSLAKAESVPLDTEREFPS